VLLPFTAAIAALPAALAAEDSAGGCP